MLLKDFMEVGKGYIQNPLGIIGLFIALVYGFASLVLITSNNLQDGHALLLVGFIVVFPFFILGVFYRLVVNHHTKLYAPKDFRDEKNFLMPRVATILEQKEKVDSEVKDDFAEHNTKNLSSKDSIRIHAIDRNEMIKRRRNILIAEDLVMRQLETEFGEFVKRNVRFETKGKSVLLDGLINLGNKIMIVEIKYFQDSKNIGLNLDFTFTRFFGKINLLINEFIRRFHCSNISLIFIVVTDKKMGADDPALIRFNKSIDGTTLPIEFRQYSLNELKQGFGI